MILVLLTVATVGIFAAGLLVGLYVDRRRYRAPEHPAMRPYRARRLRLIEGGRAKPYDWQREEGA